MKKALGQFFTPESAAELMASLVFSIKKPSRVLDPMSGEGALIEAIIREANLRKIPVPACVGCEIDGELVARSKSKLPDAQIIHGDAFIQLRQFQMVDTIVGNPPYVRFNQLGALANSGYFPGVTANGNPNGAIAEEVRRRLLALIPGANGLSRALRTLAEAYPATADLSTPAWLAMWPKLEDGGVLAFIVPRTWDSRDYGLILEYFLFRFFDMQFVVHLGSGFSFSGAEVATDLIVATKRDADRFEDSVLKSAHPADLNYKEFWIHDAAQAADLVGAVRNGQTNRIKHRIVSLDELRRKVLSRVATAKRTVSDAILDTDSKAGVAVAEQSSLWASRIVGVSGWISMESAGIDVNQGLRTGCNDFVYGRVMDCRNGSLVLDIAVAEQLNLGRQFSLPEGMSRPCIRYFDEVDCLVVGKNHRMQWHILAFEDGPKNTKLRELIDAAERRPVLVKGRSMLIPTLSALRDLGLSETRRRPWYQLDFRKRHYGDLFLPRINNGQVVACLNVVRQFLVDANFATLTVTGPIRPIALLAFLNSTPARLMMEGLGTPMGGGALKLEASQLRRLVVPVSGSKTWTALLEIGRELGKLKTRVLPPVLQERIDVAVLAGEQSSVSANDLSERLGRVMRWRRREKASLDTGVASFCNDRQHRTARLRGAGLIMLDR